MIFQIKIKNKLESALENTLGGQGHDQTGLNTKDEILKLTICLYLETFWSGPHPSSAGVIKNQNVG